MQQRGYKLTGIDGSGEMLKYAELNSPDSQFILEDARFFKSPATFDAVVSTQYGLNHVLLIDELKSVFQNVHAALLPNGWFMFDLRLHERYNDTWNNSMGGDIKQDPDFSQDFRKEGSKTARMYVAKEF
ncbi:Ubiqui/menaqui biosynthesis C-methylase UbiE [Nostoc flagelliforme CCNUN1]|uniref:Ubiqui/menaqui biosynthesis C-methylase UbiE n=1 Tax=Nostoc flagelliforme CCNUN1 TaxID=2038116 RepID=A0A2K8T1T0_9NOSO|nr:Ubiqui/menaqui biosynthesis C-methylase UbiE [Nostoc flagelliforme CCNUN1]